MSTTGPIVCLGVGEVIASLRNTSRTMTEGSTTPGLVERQQRLVDKRG